MVAPPPQLVKKHKVNMIKLNVLSVNNLDFS